jgi:protein-S-isoprenylcysteine O-methyltransferase Ste14
MFDTALIRVFVNKVPDLKSPWKVLLTLLYVLFLSGLCVLFFYYVDRTAPYMPLVSQLVMALLVTFISYLHFKQAVPYRQKYGALAYRYYFYHFMLPYLVTWYACCFHPLFVGGTVLLPWWFAIGGGALLLALTALTGIHIERAGFHEMTHGMDIYTVFPEETTVVHGEIYGYIRHPLYFALTCGTFALAFFRNTPLALLVALLQLIPALAAGYMEDRELIERSGETHRRYVQKTAMLFPLRRLGSFLKLLFFAGR